MQRSPAAQHPWRVCSQHWPWLRVPWRATVPLGQATAPGWAAPVVVGPFDVEAPNTPPYSGSSEQSL
ncbi:MAG: hypothetical protein MK290_02145 [Pedosphaera sp.]|nr:hypothetical protein [Pedosphaera sp.]